MTEIKLIKLQERFHVIDSDFPNLHYAVDKQGTGLCIIQGNQVIEFGTENYAEIADELKAVGKMYLEV